MGAERMGAERMGVGLWADAELLMGWDGSSWWEEEEETFAMR